LAFLVWFQYLPAWYWAGKKCRRPSTGQLLSSKLPSLNFTYCGIGKPNPPTFLRRCKSSPRVPLFNSLYTTFLIPFTQPSVQMSTLQMSLRVGQLLQQEFSARQVYTGSRSANIPMISAPAALVNGTPILSFSFTAITQQPKKCRKHVRHREHFSKKVKSFHTIRATIFLEKLIVSTDISFSLPISYSRLVKLPSSRRNG
jgi:hypothetical protein